MKIEKQGVGRLLLGPVNIIQANKTLPKQRSACLVHFACLLLGNGQIFVFFFYPWGIFGVFKIIANRIYEIGFLIA